MAGGREGGGTSQSSLHHWDPATVEAEQLTGHLATMNLALLLALLLSSAAGWETFLATTLSLSLVSSLQVSPHTAPTPTTTIIMKRSMTTMARMDLISTRRTWKKWAEWPRWTQLEKHLKWMPAQLLGCLVILIIYMVGTRKQKVFPCFSHDKIYDAQLLLQFWKFSPSLSSLSSICVSSATLNHDYFYFQ